MKDPTCSSEEKDNRNETNSSHKKIEFLNKGMPFTSTFTYLLITLQSQSPFSRHVNMS